MRLGIDMDGVVADFDKVWVDRYNTDFDTSIEYKHLDHWDSLVTLTHFDNYDQWWKWARSCHSDMFLAAPPLPGAVEAIRQLARDGHKICFITAKPRWAAGHPSTWLINHDIPYDEIHVTRDKKHVLCDVYIDDAEHNLKDYLYHTDGFVIQYAPWPYVNGGKRLQADTSRFQYCTSWDEIVKQIEYLEVIGCGAV